VPGGKNVRREFTVRVPQKIGAGRNVFVVRGKVGEELEPSDSFLALDIER
jgi:hypothetical protein